MGERAARVGFYFPSSFAAKPLVGGAALSPPKATALEGQPSLYRPSLGFHTPSPLALQDLGFSSESDGSHPLLI